MNSDQKKSSDHDDMPIIPSVLNVKASEECDQSALDDMLINNEQNKSIAELLDDQKEEKNNQTDQN